VSSNVANVSRIANAGLGASLTPDNCISILIDHQPFQITGLRRHDTQTVINNMDGLAKSAKLFGVPTLLTTVVEERGGFLIKQLQDVFPDRKPTARSPTAGKIPRRRAGTTKTGSGRAADEFELG